MDNNRPVYIIITTTINQICNAVKTYHKRADHRVGMASNHSGHNIAGMTHVPVESGGNYV